MRFWYTHFKCQFSPLLLFTLPFLKCLLKKGGDSSFLLCSFKLSIKWTCCHNEQSFIGCFADNFDTTFFFHLKNKFAFLCQQMKLIENFLLFEKLLRISFIFFDVQYLFGLFTKTFLEGNQFFFLWKTWTKCNRNIWFIFIWKNAKEISKLCLKLI